MHLAVVHLRLYLDAVAVNFRRQHLRPVEHGRIGRCHTVDIVRKIILQLSMSVDGFFEGPGRELDWHQVDDELHQHFNDVLARMSVFIDGRVNYELMAAYWPHADEDPNASPPEREFARIWREMPKIVYSRTLQHAEWNATVRREVDPDEIRALKQQ